MCVQDIKIGRSTEANAVEVDGGQLPGVHIFPPDAERIALIVAGSSNITPTIGTYFGVGTSVNSVIVPLGFVSGTQLVTVIRIEDVGVLIQGEVVIAHSGNLGTLFIVATVRLTRSLKDI